jgi:hypothetical protein
MWSWPVIAETEPLVKRRHNQRGSGPGLEKPSHSIEDPLPFKNFDEGALHLKRFASRCTNGAGVAVVLAESEHQDACPARTKERIIDAR